MEGLINRTIARAKKLLVLLLLIPLLTGVISYIVESKSTTIYTAETKVKLGNFENDEHTSPEFVKEKFKSPEFIKTVNSEESQKLVAQDIIENMSISVNNKFLTIELSHENKDYAQTALEALTKKFIKESNAVYKEKVELNEKSIKAISTIVTAEELVLKEELLNDLEKEIGVYNENELWEPISVSASYTNPFKRAVFGVILGLLVSISIVILPEIMRKD